MKKKYPRVGEYLKRDMDNYWFIVKILKCLKYKGKHRIYKVKEIYCSSEKHRGIFNGPSSENSWDGRISEAFLIPPTWKNPSDIILNEDEVMAWLI